jgi:hypothetical protein
VSNKRQLLDVEVQLNPQVFRDVIQRGPFILVIDWFASSENNQLPRFFAWHADPFAEGIDAFDFCWSAEPGFMFPLFALIPRILRKVSEDRAAVILLHPDWPGAVWAPNLRRMAVHREALPQSADLLRYPNRPGLRHPMKDLKLVAYSWLVGASMT